MSRLALAAGLVLLAVEVALAVAIIATSDHVSEPAAVMALAVSGGVAFVLAGLVAVVRRPKNRTGYYLALVGYTWFVGALSSADDATLFSIGHAIGPVVFGPLAALALVHPTGRFGSRFEAAVPWVVTGSLVALTTTRVLVDPELDGSCARCPENALAVGDVPWLQDVLAVALAVVVAGFVVLLATLMARRWQQASPALRRTLSPVLVSIAVLLGALVIDALVTELASQDASDATSIAFFVAFALVPFAFLFGVLRTRLARSSVMDLAIALQEGKPLRETLADALGDPTLDITYRIAGSATWVDAEGHRRPEPQPRPGRGQTTIERTGLPIAVLDYDAALADDRELFEGIAATASLFLSNERLNASLRAQYTFLEAITDTAPSLMVNVGTDGKILNQNQAAVAAAGFDDEEAVRGRYFWDVYISDEERRDMVARFRALSPEFPPTEYENRFTNERGEERVIYWRSAPVHDEEGTVVSIIAGGLDITERHRLEEEKEREREFLNAIANNAPSLLCLVDQEGRVADRATNIAFESTLGYETEETGGHVFWERYVAPEHAAEVRELFERVLAGERVGEHDHRWLTSTGETPLIGWTCTPLPQLDERRLFLVSGVDVTERHLREVELQRERDFLSATANAIPTLLVLVEEDATVSHRGANDAFKRVLGFEERELVGRSLWEVLAPPGERDELDRAFRRSIAADTPQLIESRWYTRDGSVRLVEWTTITRLGGEGRRRYLISANDVTVRRHYEDEIRASRSRIVQAEGEARRRLERNLHDGAQQRLVALSVALRLVGSKLGKDDEAAAALLEGARTELTLALEELRELARGIHPAVLTDRGLAPALEGLVGRAPVPVTLDVPAERLAPAVEAAAYYVVSESLANLAKYAQASSAEVSLTPVNGVLTVTVTDDGVGGADPQAGSGLRGLADRVEALEGTFAVVSPEGRGTTVRAEIPLHPAPPTPG